VLLGLATLGGSALAGTYTPTPGDERAGRAAKGKLEYRKDVAIAGSPAPMGGDDVVCSGQDYKVIGGGLQTAGSPSTTQLDDTRPTGFGDGDAVPDDGWHADLTVDSNANAVTYAICRRGVGLRYLHAQLPATLEGGVRSASLDCGGGGYHVVSGGAASGPSGTFLNSSYPYDGDDRNRAPDDGWAMTLFDPVGGIDDVYAICKRGKKIDYVKRVRRKVKAGEFAAARVRCDKRLHAVGGGLRLTGDGDEAHAVSTSPIDRLKERGLAPDDGWRSVGFNASGSAKKLVAHAICIRK
jgi:hypothetical protein